MTTDPGEVKPAIVGLPPPRPDPPTASSCEPYREMIELALSRGRNAMAVWQDLVSDHSFAGSYQAVKRFVRKLRGVRWPEAAGIIQTGPGEEVQVDYGSGPMVRDPKTGKYRWTRLFVMALRQSQNAIQLLIIDDFGSQTSTDRSGGIPRRVSNVNRNSRSYCLIKNVSENQSVASSKMLPKDWSNGRVLPAVEVVGKWETRRVFQGRGASACSTGPVARRC